MTTPLITLVFFFSLAGCATMSRGAPIARLQEPDVRVAGYTTSDGQHHRCDCTAILVEPDKVRFEGSRKLYSNELAAQLTPDDDYKAVPFSFLVMRTDLASVDIVQPSPAGTFVVAAFTIIAVVGVAVLVIGLSQLHGWPGK